VNRWFLQGAYAWRIATTGWSIALLLWLLFEDSDPRSVMSFALAGCLLVALRFTPAGRARTPVQDPEPPEKPLFRLLLPYLLAGLLAGLVSAPVGVAVMAMKSGLHSHSIPDFSGAQVMATLTGTPLWAAAGILLGLGVGLLQAANERER
jgi:hypothetical protein